MATMSSFGARRRAGANLGPLPGSRQSTPGAPAGVRLRDLGNRVPEQGGEPGMADGGAHDARDESQAERDDRNLAELLQELRVAGLGVQVLFGFLLSLPFTTVFKQLCGGGRDLYLACLGRARVATALLLGPVAYHRLVFRQGEKEKLVQTANVMAILGLIAVGLAVSCSFLLVAGFVAGYTAGSVIAGLVLVMFALLWFALPLARR